MSLKDLKDYRQVSLKEADLGEKADFSSIFSRPGPVHVEVGSGKGTFLVAQAREFAEINFLGIEWANKYYRYAVDRIGRWGIENVRVLRTDAAWFISEKLGAETVDCFHIYFPDPWPKKRHHKRRLISSENTVKIIRALKKGGILQLATDHEGYFEQMREVADEMIEKGLVREVEFVRPAGAEEGEAVGTNFERKYRKEGRSVNTLALKKK